jgi:DNA-binding cell septation regulator SpoVG
MDREAPGMSPPRPAVLEILALRRVEGQGTVRAFVDLRLGGVTIRGCKIIQQDDQRAWLGMPATKLTHGWSNVVEITSKDLRRRMTDVVLAAWERGQ